MPELKKLAKILLSKYSSNLRELETVSYGRFLTPGVQNDSGQFRRNYIEELYAITKPCITAR